MRGALRHLQFYAVGGPDHGTKSIGDEFDCQYRFEDGRDPLVAQYGPHWLHKSLQGNPAATHLAILSLGDKLPRLSSVNQKPPA